MLEMRAHAKICSLPRIHSWIEILIGNNIGIEEVNEVDGPGWDAAAQSASRRYGDRWYDAGRTAVLVVPSIVTRVEHNILINQDHPQFGKIRPTDRGYHKRVQPDSIPLEITPQDIQRRLDAGEKLILIDVREPSEYALARLDGAELIPMRTVPAELSRLDGQADEGTLIVYCHHGVRSLNVVNWLRGQGVEACQSMVGGIDRWSREIDPTVPRYS